MVEETDIQKNNKTTTKGNLTIMKGISVALITKYSSFL